MVFECKVQYLLDCDPFNYPRHLEPLVAPPTYAFVEDEPLVDQLPHVHRLLNAPIKICEAALQLSNNQYYLDLNLSIQEQKEIFDGFKNNPDNTVILRTQLLIRVHCIIATLINSTGIELYKALISLKTVFEDDIDMVYEFVESDGISCLLALGMADENHYLDILRVIGEIMVYVDGINGISEHYEILKWIYSLLSSTCRSVQVASLKALVVFAGYSEEHEEHSKLIWEVIQEVDEEENERPLKRVIHILSKPENNTDIDLLVHTMTFINNLIIGIEDRGLFYDIVDALEEWGMESISSTLMELQSSSSNLYQLLNIYELSITLEDQKCNEEGLYCRAAVGHPRDEPRPRIDRRSMVGTKEGKDAIWMLKQKFGEDITNLKDKIDPVTGEEKEYNDEIIDPVQREKIILRKRKLIINAIDFTDMTEEDDNNFTENPSITHKVTIPQPPPGTGPPPPPPPPGTGPRPPPLLHNTHSTPTYVKLHWEKVKTPHGIESVWGSIKPVVIDTPRIQSLFEKIPVVSSATLHTQKKETSSLTVFDKDRTQKIIIMSKKMPSLDMIEKSLINMDKTILSEKDAENIRSIINSCSTEDVQKLLDAREIDKDTPFPQAENFLWTLLTIGNPSARNDASKMCPLDSIKNVTARIEILLFMIYFDDRIKEISNLLHDIKKSISQIRENETLRIIMGTILTIGNILNGKKVEGFDPRYLSNVNDVKDTNTKNKNSLLYHVCTTVIENYPNSTDLHSELSSVHKIAAKEEKEKEGSSYVFDLIDTLDTQWLSAMEKLKSIESLSFMTRKEVRKNLDEALDDIIILKVIHRRVNNRFTKLQQFMGMPLDDARKTREESFCKIISDFSLTYKDIHKVLIEEVKSKNKSEKRVQTRGKQTHSVGSKDIEIIQEMKNMLLKKTRKTRISKDVNRLSARRSKKD